jgi:thioredoxin reductase
MIYDVVIAGGGPAGLSAALALGRARKRVLLCDAGPRRNAAAEHIYNFVTRDGAPPAEFRRIAREQLAAYPNVHVVDEAIAAIGGQSGAFTVALSSSVTARRILICTGMIDEMLPIPGFRELWGHSIFQCPYCHGWEARDRRWGYLVVPQTAGHALPFALQARSWTRDVTVFTNAAVEIVDDALAQVTSAGIRVETGAVARLAAHGDQLEAVELMDGTVVGCDVLFTHPPQRQVDLVRTLGLSLDDDGCVKVDEMKRETSVPGIYAAGDLTTRRQGAIVAAAAGTHAAAAINMELSIELAVAGALEPA